MVFLLGDVNFYNINSSKKDAFTDGAWSGENHFITLLLDISNPNCYTGHNRMQIRSAVTRSNIPVVSVILLPGNLPKETFVVYNQVYNDFGDGVVCWLGLNYLPNTISLKKFKNQSEADFKQVLEVRQQIGQFYLKNYIQYLEPYSIFYYWSDGCGKLKKWHNSNK